MVTPGGPGWAIEALTVEEWEGNPGRAGVGGAWPVG